MKRTCVIVVLLAACATSGERRYVVLESEAYGCGAAEGLGCGLAIAPVLHQIDELEGVGESSTSWDGRYFRIELEPGADSEHVSAAAAGLLQGEACCVTEPRGKAAPAGPEQWYDEERTRLLSRHEAGVIASHYADVINSEVELAPDSVKRLQTVLREELELAFERAHAAGGGVDRLWDQLPEASARFEKRLAEFLTPEQRAQVVAITMRELGA